MGTFPFIEADHINSIYQMKPDEMTWDECRELINGLLSQMLLTNVP